MTRGAWVLMGMMLGGCDPKPGSEDAGPGDADADTDSTTETGTGTSTETGTGTGGGGTIIAAEGGYVESDDGLFFLLIPPDALAEDTTFEITKLPEAEWPEAAPALAPLAAEVYDVEPDVELSIPGWTMHFFETAPGALLVDADHRLAAHHQTAGDGTVQSASKSETWYAERGVLVVGTIERTSIHWDSEWIDSDGWMAARVGTIEDEAYVDSPFSVTELDLVSSADRELDSAGASADVYFGDEGGYLEPLMVYYPAELGLPAWADFTPDEFQDAVGSFEWPSWVFSYYDVYGSSAGSTTADVSVSANVPQPLATPGPSFVCSAVGAGEDEAWASWAVEVGKVLEGHAFLGRPTCSEPVEPACDLLAVDGGWVQYDDVSYGATTDSVGDPGTPDLLTLLVEPSVSGVQPLAAPANADDCGWVDTCLFFAEDVTYYYPSAHVLIATEGEVDLGASETPTAAGTITGANFEEITVDPDTLDITFLGAGICYALGDEAFP